MMLGERDPYYLEAGFDKYRGTPSGVHGARLYNEQAYLLSLQTVRSAAPLPALPFGELLAEVSWGSMNWEIFYVTLFSFYFIYFLVLLYLFFSTFIITDPNFPLT